MLKPCLIFCWQCCGGYMWINGKQLPTAAFFTAALSNVTHSLKYEHCSKMALLLQVFCEPEESWEWGRMAWERQRWTLYRKSYKEYEWNWSGWGTVFAEMNITKAGRDSSDFRNYLNSRILWKVSPFLYKHFSWLPAGVEQGFSSHKLQSQVLWNTSGQFLLCAEQEKLVSGLHQPAPDCRFRSVAVVKSNTDMVNSMTLDQIIQPLRKQSMSRCWEPSVSFQ